MRLRSLLGPLGVALGLAVVLDVNNHELRALENAEMEAVLEFAGSLWPDQMLEYINELGDSG